MKLRILEESDDIENIVIYIISLTNENDSLENWKFVLYNKIKKLKWKWNWREGLL